MRTKFDNKIKFFFIYMRKNVIIEKFCKKYEEEK